jgi:small-conductance mechanosensitive channel
MAEEPQTVSLREYFERVLKDLQDRMDERGNAADKAIAAALAASKEAVAAALVSQDKSTAAAFAAAKEALTEAQTQLVAYKASSNEWRGTLNDLTAKMMLRTEVEAAFTAVAAAALAMQKTIDDKIEGLRKKVADLESAGQRGAGKEEASEEGKVQSRWTFNQVLIIVGILLGALYFVLTYQKAHP